MICKKCKKEINSARDTIAMQKYILKIAKMECGCAPSAGYMEKLILEARKTLRIITDGKNNTA